MIYDKIEKLEDYVTLNEGFKEVVEYIKKTDLLALPLGKQKLSDKVNISRQEYVGKEELDSKYESHIKYIDIQIVLENKEKCYTSFENAVVTEINEKDFYSTEAKRDANLTLSKGNFVIFFPGELHKPGLRINEEKVQKIIFKVLA